MRHAQALPGKFCQRQQDQDGSDDDGLHEQDQEGHFGDRTIFQRHARPPVLGEDVLERFPVDAGPAGVLVKERAVVGGGFDLRGLRGVNGLQVRRGEESVIDGVGGRLVRRVANFGGPVIGVRRRLADAEDLGYRIDLLGGERRFLHQKSSGERKPVPPAQLLLPGGRRIAVSEEVRREIGDAARGQSFAAGGEETADLRLGPGEIKDAVGFQMVEVIFEGFTR